MSGSSELGPESSAVHTHVTLLQGIIKRMAENSRLCKVWCVTLVSGVLVLAARTGDSQHVLMAFIPTLLFFGLDAYHLGLEKLFRDCHDKFVEALHDGQDITGLLFRFRNDGGWLRSFKRWLGAALRPAVSFFYVGIVLAVWVACRTI